MHTRISGTLLLAYGIIQQAVSQTAPTVSNRKLMSYPKGINIKPRSYIVEFNSNADADRFISNESKRRTVPQFTITNQYREIFNGLAMMSNVDNDDPGVLTKIPNVKRVWPVKIHTAPYEHSKEMLRDYAFLHHATGVDRARVELGLDGKGVKIGIIDSGVDYRHPELGGCWKTPGCIWQRGWDFVGDEYSPRHDNPVIRQDPDPMDCTGHGTHVSGIIGAGGPLVQGIATGATLGMYRVFSCPNNGSAPTSDDVILEAIEAVYKDGNDIVSLSLGGGTWPEDPLSVACSNLVQKGVIVVAANGNDGAYGLFTANSPSLGRGVISVGSVDNWNATGPALIINAPQGTKRALISGPANSKIPFNFEQYTLIEAPLDSSGNTKGCEPFDVSLENKIALIERGVCEFGLKAMNAEEAGAAGVIIYNNGANLLTPTIDGHNVSIPVVLVSADDGRYIINGLATNLVSVAAPKGEFTTAPKGTGGMISPFSSIGPSPELDMAPLVSAPGGSIFSTFITKGGGYASLSGTSMATPYITGAIALLKQARPNLSVDEIRSVLFTSANPIRDQKTGLYINPYKSGAGLVNIYGAIKSRAIISPPMISINMTEYGIIKLNEYQYPNPTHWSTHRMSIHNSDESRQMTIGFENLPADSLSSWDENGNYTATPRMWPVNHVDGNDKYSVPFVFSPNLSDMPAVPPGQKQEFNLTIISPSTLTEYERWFYGGFIKFTLAWEGTDDRESYIVPYSGFKGDYYKLDVLADVDEGYPAIGDINGTEIEDLYNYQITNETPLVVNYRLEVPSRLVSLRLLNLENKPIGYLLSGYNEYLPKNFESIRSYVYIAIFNGTVYVDPNGEIPYEVPTGNYYIRLDALRPFGDADNLDSYQSWVSDVFKVEVPTQQTQI